MRVFVELSGEHPTLPRAEALAAMEAERVDVRAVAWDSKVLCVTATGPVERALARLGLAHVACEELVHGDFDAIRAYARDTDLAGRTFRVRARGAGANLDVAAVEGALGADFGRTGRVDLSSPSYDMRLVMGEEFRLGRVVHRVLRSALEARKVARRPFSLPISLHPKLARALVNLSRVPTAGWMLDPFCGTGGIVLEASRIGLHGIGSDLRRSMVLGARKSLRTFDATADFAVADAGRGPWRAGSIHGIATDPPYGRAASTRGEPLDRLYERFFSDATRFLTRGRTAAVVLPNARAIEIGERHMELIETHAMRVHRSLTRTFCAFLNSR